MRYFAFSRCMRGAAALMLAASLVVPVASAETVDQSKWAARKAQVTLLANRQTISFIEIGDPKAPPVLLLHGISDTSRSFSLIAPHLSGFRLLIPDLRGHGGSDRPECCYAVVDMAWDAKLFLDAMQIERAHVIGHSLGSMVAQNLAANWPERVDRLVLIGSTSGAPVVRDDWFWTEVHKLKDPIDPEGEFVRTLQSAPTPLDPVFHSHVLRESAAVPAQVFRSILRELVQMNFAPLAPDIKAPTLIVWGEKDEMFGAEVQARLREALPQAQFRAFAGLGHNPHWERPDEFGRVIAEFLRE